MNKIIKNIQDISQVIPGAPTLDIEDTPAVKMENLLQKVAETTEIASELPAENSVPAEDAPLAPETTEKIEETK